MDLEERRQSEDLNSTYMVLWPTFFPGMLDSCPSGRTTVGTWGSGKMISEEMKKVLKRRSICDVLELEEDRIRTQKVIWKQQCWVLGWGIRFGGVEK